VQSTLEVRVNDILWTEVPSLYGTGPNDRIYVTRTSDEGRTAITFGDGRTGARLPTGQENVRARYRKGIGAAGLVKANQLTQLMTRPAGLKSVTNPNAAEAAADPEKLGDARRNATLTILTLERVVSLQDYEDFARAFAGIGKALATWTWNGETRGVFLTVAGTGGAAVPEDSELAGDLLKLIRDAGDPNVPLALASYGQRFFRIAAGLRLDPAFEAEKVLAAVETGLREQFAFEPRAFGQPVALSEAITLMQQVKGVIAVDVNAFYRSDEAEQRATLLPAAKPRPGSDAVFPAELLTLDPRPVDLEVLP
jgi:predicted phage baseplate assembly protein